MGLHCYASSCGVVEVLWAWDRIFQHLVENCDESGGEYCLPIEEAARFKKGQVRKGWGIYNFKKNVLPRYQPLYPEYDFKITNKRRYLCCTHKGYC